MNGAERGARMDGCEVLAVFAHPDDESLLAGGTLAACAAAGLSVSIVSMTRGELGAAAERRAMERAALGRLRERELAKAAAALGVAWARCLGFPDGELGSIDRRTPVRALAELVAQERPTATITFSAEGLYWHPDHIAVHEIVHEVLPAASICELTWPAGLLARIVEELRRRGLPADVWGLDPHAFGAPADAIARELDVSPFLDVKLAALRCHRSQLVAGHALADLPRDLALELLGREWLVIDPQGDPSDRGTPLDWLTAVVAEGCSARSRP